LHICEAGSLVYYITYRSWWLQFANKMLWNNLTVLGGYSIKQYCNISHSSVEFLISSPRITFYKKFIEFGYFTSPVLLSYNYVFRLLVWWITKTETSVQNHEAYFTTIQLMSAKKYCSCGIMNGAEFLVDFTYFISYVSTIHE
jgi:hypothetical protein